MGEWKIIDTQLVKVEYRRGVSVNGEGVVKPVLHLTRDCGLDCGVCGATIHKPSMPPTLECAIDEVLCFNNGTLEGISGRIIRNGPDVWEFEITAKRLRSVEI